MTLKENFEKNWKKYFIGGTIGVATSMTGILIGMAVAPINQIPNMNNVQQGYVNSKNVKFHSSDFDNDGKRELCLDYRLNGSTTKHYVLKMDDSTKGITLLPVTLNTKF
jgi:hypothetical protein